MSKEMKGWYVQRTIKNSVQWALWWMLQGQKGTRTHLRPRNMKSEAWSPNSQENSGEDWIQAEPVRMRKQGCVQTFMGIIASLTQLSLHL